MYLMFSKNKDVLTSSEVTINTEVTPTVTGKNVLHDMSQVVKLRRSQFD